MKNLYDHFLILINFKHIEKNYNLITLNNATKPKLTLLHYITNQIKTTEIYL